MNRYKVQVLANLRIDGTMAALDEEGVRRHIQWLIDSANKEFGEGDPVLKIENTVGIDIQQIKE